LRGAAGSPVHYRLRPRKRLTTGWRPPPIWRTCGSGKADLPKQKNCSAPFEDCLDCSLWVPKSSSTPSAWTFVVECL